MITKCWRSERMHLKMVPRPRVGLVAGHQALVDAGTFEGHKFVTSFVHDIRAYLANSTTKNGKHYNVVGERK